MIVDDASGIFIKNKFALRGNPKKQERTKMTEKTKRMITIVVLVLVTTAIIIAVTKIGRVFGLYFN